MGSYFCGKQKGENTGAGRLPASRRATNKMDWLRMGLPHSLPPHHHHLPSLSHLRPTVHTFHGWHFRDCFHYPRPLELEHGKPPTQVLHLGPNSKHACVLGMVLGFVMVASRSHLTLVTGLTVLVCFFSLLKFGAPSLAQRCIGYD